MLKKTFNILKKVIFSSFVLYGYNLIVAPLGITIPINVITVLVVSLLGMPGLFSLIGLLIFIY